MDKEEKANVVIIHYLFAISPQTRKVGLSFSIKIWDGVWIKEKKANVVSLLSLRGLER